MWEELKCATLEPKSEELECGVHKYSLCCDDQTVLPMGAAPLVRGSAEDHMEESPGQLVMNMSCYYYCCGCKSLKLWRHLLKQKNLANPD